MILGEIIGELVEAVVCSLGDTSISGKDKLVGFLIILGIIGVVSLIIYLI